MSCRSVVDVDAHGDRKERHELENFDRNEARRIVGTEYV